MSAPPTLEQMRDAQRRQDGVVTHTPLVAAGGASCLPDDPPLLLKLENLQPISSFKIRGIYNAVASLSDEDRARGLLTVSAGNTAQALAWCGRHFDVAARSVMPETAPQAKIDRVRALGGEPVLVPGDEVFRFLREHLWDDDPAVFVHPWTEPRVWEGHASLGLEIAEACPDVKEVYVPVGGGGLFVGVASALRELCPEARLIAVEPASCPALRTSLERDAPVQVACQTISDGVAVPYITEEVFPLLRDLVHDVVLVSEKDTVRALRDLALQQKVIAEPSGALAFAAARERVSSRRGPAVALVTGGSVDERRLSEWLALG